MPRRKKGKDLQLANFANGSCCSLPYVFKQKQIQALYDLFMHWSPAKLSFQFTLSLLFSSHLPRKLKK
jgi:hypothetical protein